MSPWRRALGPAGAPDERAADCAPTPRETTVLLLLTDALTADAIARRLGISVRTVHKHVENIYRKLGTHDRLGTVLRAQQLGHLRQQPAQFLRRLGGVLDDAEQAPFPVGGDAVDRAIHVAARPRRRQLLA
ncbi:response regulator transcription factor [Streptomyces fodineus]|uniref:response regulator transcription factor n=1 Tax=Streptomyces fodineus TaxID=1904616 RepID=UPI0030026AE5